MTLQQSKSVVSLQSEHIQTTRCFNRFSTVGITEQPATNTSLIDCRIYLFNKSEKKDPQAEMELGLRVTRPGHWVSDFGRVL